MNLLENKTIAIIGGGPGGLTLARLLQMQGATVNVYERDVNKDVRVQGATLDLHDESGLAALRKAGLMDAFTANYRPGADKLRIVDKHAVVLLDQHEEEAKDTFSDPHFRPEIDRGPLRKILLESLNDGTVIWDCYLTSLKQTEGKWQLSFHNGTHATADLVIAADGANSKVRPSITPVKPFYSGVTILEGAVYNAATTVPGVHALVNDGKIFAMGDEKSLIVSSKGDGSLVFYLGIKTPESWSSENGLDYTDKAQVKAWFEQTFTSWNPIWLELFDHAEPKFIPRPQYCMPLDQTWDAQSNITMLGDAAHLMPPYAGEGVNMAMQDALELSECLANNSYTYMQDAIAAYEQQMRTRASEVAGLTLEQTAILHSDKALDHLLELMG